MPTKEGFREGVIGKKGRARAQREEQRETRCEDVMYKKNIYSWEHVNAVNCAYRHEQDFLRYLVSYSPFQPVTFFPESSFNETMRLSTILSSVLSESIAY